MAENIKKFTRNIPDTSPVEYESIPSGESVTLSWSGTPNYQIGDILVLKNEYSSGNNDLELGNFSAGVSDIKIELQNDL